MNEIAIRDRLVKHGEDLLKSPKQPCLFTRIPAADVLLNDLDAYPHAFVLACAMDRQIKAEKAWIIPHLISEKLGGFSIEMLAGLSRANLIDLMSKPESLHRFPDTMAGIFYSAVQRICNDYAGDAASMWKETPSSAEVVYRFLKFDGIGPKIATMAVNLLARNFKIPFADHYSVDISADSHVRRVFGRLGLCSPDADVG